MNPPPDVNVALDPRLVFGIIALSALAACVVSFTLRSMLRAENDPRTILQRCRLQLRAARQEIELYPATREIHQILDGIDSAAEHHRRNRGRPL